MTISKFEKLKTFTRILNVQQNLTVFMRNCCYTPCNFIWVTNFSLTYMHSTRVTCVSNVTWHTRWYILYICMFVSDSIRNWVSYAGYVWRCGWDSRIIVHTTRHVSSLNSNWSFFIDEQFNETIKCQMLNHSKGLQYLYKLNSEELKFRCRYLSMFSIIENLRRVTNCVHWVGQ